jgi:hypothetical protein
MDQCIPLEASTRVRVALSPMGATVAAVGRDCARITRQCLYAPSSRHAADLSIRIDM